MSKYEDTIGGNFFYVKKKDDKIWIVVRDGFSEAVYGSESEAIAHIKGFRSGYGFLANALHRVAGEI